MTVSERTSARTSTAHSPDPPLIAEAPLPEIVIRPSGSWSALNVSELWAYRELLYFLVWRNIKIRYKQTVFGAAWAIIQPFFTMVVFSIFFGELAGVPSEGVPYPIFAYSALVPWMYFANALSQASNSLTDHEAIITKVYFPRVLLPAASVLTGLVDFTIAFTVLIGMMLFYGIVPTTAIWTLPLLVLLAMATALGAGLWLAALNVQYRDVRLAVPFLIQFWLFATPIAYSSSLVPEPWRAMLGLNPMAGVVEGFRWALLGQARAPGPLLFISTLIAIGMVASGLYYFRRMERSFADVV